MTESRSTALKLQAWDRSSQRGTGHFWGQRRRLLSWKVVAFSRVCAWVEADQTGLFKDGQAPSMVLGKYLAFFPTH